MKWNKIIWIFVMFFLIIGTARAIVYSDYVQLVYNDFEASAGNFTALNSGVCIQNATTPLEGAKSLYIKSLSDSGENGCKVNANLSTTANIFTISFMMKSASDDINVMIGDAYSNANAIYINCRGATRDIRYYAGSWKTIKNNGGCTFTNFTISITKSSDKWNLTINGTLHNHTLSPNGNPTQYGLIWFAGGNGDNGYIDLFRVYNGTTEPTPPPPAPMNLTDIRPYNTTFHDHTFIYFNATANSTSPFNVSLYLNNALNKTLYNLPAGNNTELSFNLTLGNALYNYSMKALNSNGSWSNTSVRYFTIDTVDPVISFDNYTFNTLTLMTDLNITDINIGNYTYNTSCGGNYVNTSSNNPIYHNQAVNLTNCGLGIKWFNVTACDKAGNCVYENYRFWSMARVNVSAHNLGGGSVDNFSVYFNGTYMGYSTEGNATIDNLSSTLYNITIDPPDFEIPTGKAVYTNITFNAVNFYIYSINSILFTFRDEETKNIINTTNITVDLISNIYSLNITNISNGSLYVDLLEPADYDIRYSASGYYTNHYFLTLSNRTHHNLTLYMLNVTSASNITATVYDQTSTLLENVYIYIMRYNLNTNTYELVGQAKTNFMGTAILSLVKNVEYYKFMLYYPFGTLRKETSPTYIYEDTINFQIHTAEETAQYFFNSQGIDYSLIFNEDTNNFRYTFNDPHSNIVKGCLKVYQVTALDPVLINNTCTAGISGTILGGVPAINDTTYIAKAYVYFNATHDYMIASLEHTFYGANHLGLMGVFVICAITIMFAFISIYSVSISAIITPLPLILGSYMGIINLPMPLAIGIEIIGIIIAIIIYRAG